MKEFNDKKKVMIPCRFSFLHCWEPDSVNGSEPKYSISAIIPKSDTKTINRIKAAIEVAKQESISKWGGKIPPNLKLPLRDGDIDRPDDEAYANSYFLNANSRVKPQIVDNDVQFILDPAEVYSGCYGNITVTFFGYNSNGNRGIAAGLTANEIAAATILANNIAAGAITTDKLAAESVDASKIKAGSITTNHVSSSFGESLDLSSNTSVRTTVTQRVDEAIDGIEIGGVNLIDQSADHTLAADSADSYWIAADALERGKTYTFSVREVVLVDGTAAGVTWKVVEQGAGTVHTSGLLDFTYGKQVFHFTVPDAGGNWALYLYAGISGSTSGVTVQFSKSKLEEGAFATTWSPSPDDSAAAVNRISGAVEALDSGMDDRVTSLISAMGLSDRFASAEEFLNALSQIELIRSELAQHDSDLTLTFNRLTQTENSITQIFSSFVFGDEGGTPYLDMSASASSVKMRLTNTRLAFIQSGKEMAYFSDNKLYVTRLEVVEQISIGTSGNGYLDMVTTPTGVGFKWRS